MRELNRPAKKKKIENVLQENCCGRMSMQPGNLCDKLKPCTYQTKTNDRGARCCYIDRERSMYGGG